MLDLVPRSSTAGIQGQHKRVRVELTKLSKWSVDQLLIVSSTSRTAFDLAGPRVVLGELAVV